MNRYESYKESGVEWIGEIPKYWKTTKLKYISSGDPQYGLNIGSDSYGDVGIRFVRITDIDNNRSLKPSGGVYLESKDASPEYQLHSGDILFARSGTVGKSILIENGNIPMCFAGYLVRFSFDNYLTSQFISWVAESDLYWRWIKWQIVQSTIPNINARKYSNFILPIPGKKEIKNIISHLRDKTEQIDQLIEKLEKKIELLKEQRIALINQCVTKGLDPNVEMKDSGIEWIGEIPKHWKISKLKYFASVNFSSVDRHEFDEERRVSVCHYLDTYRNEFIDLLKKFPTGTCTESEFTKYSLKNGDIVLTKDSETPDDIGIPTFIADDLENTVCGYHLAIVRVHDSSTLSQFVYRFIESRTTRDYFLICAKGITRFSLGKGSIESVYTPRPPKEEQKLIVNKISCLSENTAELIERLNSKVQLLKEYRQSLISSVVTGKVRVTEDMV